MLAAAGVTTFEVTAIDRDGLLGGPDLALLRSLVALGRGRIIASGGVSSLDDVLAVQAAGCAARSSAAPSTRDGWTSRSWCGARGPASAPEARRPPPGLHATARSDRGQ